MPTGSRYEAPSTPPFEPARGLAGPAHLSGMLLGTSEFLKKPKHGITVLKRAVHSKTGTRPRRYNAHTKERLASAASPILTLLPVLWPHIAIPDVRASEFPAARERRGIQGGRRQIRGRHQQPQATPSDPAVPWAIVQLPRCTCMRGFAVVCPAGPALHAPALAAHTPTLVPLSRICCR